MSNDLKRYAFDATRGEMFEIAHGAYVKHDDHLTALTAAVQAEREAIKEMIVRQHKVNVPDEQFRSGVHFACENLHAMIRSRGPAPAVDAKAARNEIWAADLVVTMDRLLHALEPCRGSDFGLETMESEQLEAAIADAKRALVPPTAALRALVSPTTGQQQEPK